MSEEEKKMKGKREIKGERGRSREKEERKRREGDKKRDKRVRRERHAHFIIACKFSRIQMWFFFPRLSFLV